MSAASQPPSREATANQAGRGKRPVLTALKALGALLMLFSILTVLFGSWAISESPALILICMAVWIGGFALFITARVRESSVE